MDTLQVALIVAALVAIVGIIAFNKWQEARLKRRADRAFPDNRRDPLLERGVDSAPASSVIAKPADNDTNGYGSGRSEQKQGTYRQPPRQRPPLPDRLDSRLDCCIRIEAVEPIEVPRFWAAQTEVFDGVARTLRWYAFDDRENQWRRIDGNTVGAHHWYLAALQLVDRAGMIGENDFLQYIRGMQKLADQFHAVPSGFPSRAEVLGNAKALDRFCSEVDVLIALNVISQQLMPASRIAALAEAEGLRLEGDGSFHARAADSRTLYVLSNSESALFERSSISSLQTRQVSLVLDLPRVLDAAHEFDDMMRFASHLAKSLGAMVVDDNLHPFGPESVETVRSRIRRFQTRMSEEGIPSGGSLARRLFST